MALMKKHIILTCVLLATCAAASGQTSLRQKKVTDAPQTEKKSESGSRHTASTTGNTVKTKPDTVYCMATIKRHGHFEPLGSITKEHASHLWQHVMFTCRNDKGIWQKMELMDSYGNHSGTSSFSPYIAKIRSDLDTEINKEWKDKLLTACIYEFVTDPAGENVIQERAFDKDRNLIYTFSITPIGENRFIGSYKDCYGLPAEMRPDDAYTYGTLVKITRDQWGNDSLIEYIDAKGVKKKNSDGAYSEEYVYDKAGDLVMTASQDSLGHYMTDIWGNCAIQYVFNGNHLCTSQIYLDDKMLPVRMPSEASGTTYGVMKTLREYDRWGRETEERFVTEQNIPDTNAFGCHRIVTEYDERGNTVKLSGFDLQGRHCRLDASGTAVYKYEHDSEGRTLRETFLDKNLKPVSTPGYLSGRRYAYDAEGKTILNETYDAVDGVEHVYCSVANNDDCNLTVWSDGSFKVDSLDAKGRTTFTGYFDNAGRPEMVGQWSARRTIYRDGKGRCHETEIHYDNEGRRINLDSGICMTELEIDSVAHTKFIKKYDADGNLAQTFIHRLNDDLSTTVGQYDATFDGVPTRCGGASIMAYYTEVQYSQLGQFSTFFAKDEFGEPDYISEDGNTYCYRRMLHNGRSRFYDADDNVISNIYEFRDRAPKVMTVEVIDSTAYELGLKNNDVILLYGDYAANLETDCDYLDFKAGWGLRSVLDAGKEKRMVVFRITDASKNEYGLYEITGLKGTCSELGFLAHVRYLTGRQAARIKEAVKASPLVTEEDFSKPNNPGGEHFVLIACPEMIRDNREKLYPSEVTDPSILLGACIYGLDMTWTADNGDDIEPLARMLISLDSSVGTHFFFTRDGGQIMQVTSRGQDLCTKWTYAYISDDDYNRIRNLYVNAGERVGAMQGR